MLQYFFASFLSRDEAFKLINDGWLQHSNDARAVIDQQVISLLFYSILHSYKETNRDFIDKKKGYERVIS